MLVRRGGCVVGGYVVGSVLVGRVGSVCSGESGEGV